MGRPVRAHDRANQNSSEKNYRQRLSNLKEGRKLKEVFLDVEIALNGRPLSYAEDDAQLPVLTPNSMLFSQPSILPEREVHYEENPQLRRRVKYLRKCKDVVWNRWMKEYLRGLRERHSVILNYRRK